jgi:hypothetical protein
MTAGELDHFDQRALRIGRPGTKPTGMFMAGAMTRPPSLGASATAVLSCTPMLRPSRPARRPAACRRSASGPPFGGGRPRSCPPPAGSRRDEDNTERS